jgi:antitoxin MazE
MENFIKVREKGQITLPLSVREKMDLKQGDLILVKIVDNSIVLVPQETVDKDQAWFWSERWQKQEQEAEADLREGRVKRFDSVEDMFDDIEKTSGSD